MNKAKIIDVLSPEEVDDLHSLIESDLPMLQQVKTPVSGAFADLFNELGHRVTTNFRQTCEAVVELDETLTVNRKLIGHSIEAAKKQRIDIATMLKEKGLFYSEA